MGKSSKDKRDAYYRLAKEQNWRARSAFKLIQIDEQFDLFAHADPDSVTRVVDLCAAPGSWSQVLSRVLIKGESFGRRAWLEKRRKEKRALERLEKNKDRLDDAAVDMEDGEEEDTGLKPRKNVKIVSIDLQPMAPLEGITTLKADITHPSTIPLLLRALDPEAYDSSSQSVSKQPHPVDLVLSDGAPDVTGLHDLDIYIQSQLLYAALNLAIGVLRPGGKFVAKIFRGRDVDIIYAQLRTVFQKVSVAKPRSSRASSLEAFVVCEGFIPPTREGDGERQIGLGALQDPLFGGAAAVPTGPDHTVEIEMPDGEDEEREDRTPVAVSEPVSTAPNHLIQTLVLDPSSQPRGTHPLESRWIAPFIACGDLSAWDSDASYALPEGYVSLDPVQPPTAPPYRQALELRKEKGGAYGKTKLGSIGRA
ncbi:hypothetical protein DTO212C5_5072 [Paecilomyces variotii]|nr:hypothetical protein DTO212C5_5072 [Paecilomyces variotii]